MVHIAIHCGQYFCFSFRRGSQPCFCSSGEDIFPDALNDEPSPIVKGIHDGPKVMIRNGCLKWLEKTGSGFLKCSQKTGNEFLKWLEKTRSKVFKSPISQECTLLNLPAEIRLMILEQVLVSGWIVDDPQELIGRQKSPMVTHSRQIEDIDSAILRTCRFIHKEALPLLYEKNYFSFSGLRDVESFAHHQIPHTPRTSFDYREISLFNFKPATYGRLTMLRSVKLRLAPFGGINSLRKGCHYRECMWEDWRNLFDPSPTSLRLHPVAFPALSSLFLDFTDWELDGEKGSELRVSLSTTALLAPLFPYLLPDVLTNIR